MRILIVEDDSLGCMRLESILSDAGYEIAGAAGFVEEALAMIERNPPDAAVLDLNLRGKKVYPGAEKLAAAGIPFVFATGGGLDVEGFADRPRIGKPFREIEVLDAVALMIAALDSADRKSA